MKEAIKKILDISDKTYYNWKNQNRPIVKLLEKYFEDEDLSEFIEKGTVDKFEKLNFLYENIVCKNEKLYLDSFTSNFNYNKLSSSHTIFIDFYFSFLLDLKEKESLIKFQFNSLLNNSLHNYLIKKYKKTILDDEYCDKLINDLKKDYEEIEKKDFDENTYNSLKKEIIETVDILNKNDLENILKHTHCFELWDDNMLIYLDYVLKNDMSSFLESKNEELIYHAIGFKVYSILKDEVPIVKLDLISIVQENLKDNGNKIVIEIIEECILKYKDEVINRVKEEKRYREYERYIIVY